MAKTKYYKYYWAVEQPIPADKSVNRYQPVRTGAGTRGLEIGVIGTGTIIKIDKNEVSDGWSRIISVVGNDPVPQKWIDKEREMGIPEMDFEWWTDNTGLSDINPYVTEHEYHIFTDAKTGALLRSIQVK